MKFLVSYIENVIINNTQGKLFQFSYSNYSTGKPQLPESNAYARKSEKEDGEKWKNYCHICKIYTFEEIRSEWFVLPFQIHKRFLVHIYEIIKIKSIMF